MQALLRFARGGSGALVFAHTSALREDLPVVGEGEVIRSWSETATAAAEVFQTSPEEELTTGDVAERVDVGARQVRRVLNELTQAGYLSKRETGEGRANGYASVDDPGAGEVEINAEVDAGALPNPDDAGSNIVYTANVRVHGLDGGGLGGSRPPGSQLPAPDGSDWVLVEGDPPE